MTKVEKKKPAAKKLGRPKTAEETKLLSLRLPVSLIDTLDTYAAAVALDLPGMTVSRNDAMRRLMVMGLRQAGFDDVGKTPKG